MSRDFRYRMPDGSVVEAFQMTPATRYQEDQWPPWMTSKMLMTVDNQEWLNIGDVETEIPKFGWIVRDAGGRVTALPYDVMEKADKVVKEVPVVHPEAKVDEEALIELTAKLSKRPVEEVRAEAKRKAERANAGRVARIPITPITATEVAELQQEAEETVDRGLLNDARGVYQDLLDGQEDKAIGKLKNALIDRANWCNCPPGRCNGERDTWDCRRNSPLAK